MSSLFDEMVAAWTWPYRLGTLAVDVIRTADSAHDVIAARLPLIASAWQNPLAADYPELQRMVAEKLSAFDASKQAIDDASASVRRASTRTAKAFGQLTGGGMLWPDQWFRLAEANATAFISLASLPMTAFAPVKRTVSVNARRLRDPGGRRHRLA